MDWIGLDWTGLDSISRFHPRFAVVSFPFVRCTCMYIWIDACVRISAGGSVNRAEMQKYLLGLLFPNPSDEDGQLLCGSGVDSYREDVTNRTVVVTLESGLEVTGCVLLACDGIRSRCRAVLHGGYDPSKDWETNARIGRAKDPLHFCGALAYWGKTAAPRGSGLQRAFNAMIERTDDEGDEDASGNGKDVSRAFAVLGLSSSKCPASFFVIPTQNYTMLNWAVTVRSETEATSGSNDGTDLTRRGGGPLTESEKKRLFDFSDDDNGNKNNNTNSSSLVRGVSVTEFPFLKALIDATPAADITEAGLYDRENLNLPYTSDSKLVALIGGKLLPFDTRFHWWWVLPRTRFMCSKESTDMHPRIEWLIFIMF